MHIHIKQSGIIMIRKSLIGLLLLCICTLFTGCVKYDTNIKITPTGEATAEIRILANKDKIYLPKSEVENYKTILTEYFKEKGFSISETAEPDYPQGIKAYINIKNILNCDLPKLTNGMRSVSKDGKYISGKNFLLINYYLIDWDININEVKEGENVSPEFLENAAKIENGQNNNLLYINIPYKALKHNATYLQDNNQYIWKLKTGHNSVHLEFWLFNFSGMTTLVIFTLLLYLLFFKRKNIFNRKNIIHLKKILFRTKKIIKKYILFFLITIFILFFSLFASFSYYSPQIANSIMQSVKLSLDINNYEKAEKHLNIALKINKQEALRWFLTLCYIALEKADQNDFDNADRMMLFCHDFALKANALENILWDDYHMCIDLFSARAKEKEANLQYDSAVKFYSLAIKYTQRNDPDLYLNRASAYYKMHNKNLALDDISSALRLSNSNSSAYTLRGIIFFEEKEYDAAEENFDNVIKLNDNILMTGAAYNYKSIIERDRENLQKAMEYAKLSIILFKKARNKENYNKSVNLYNSIKNQYIDSLYIQIYFYGYSDEYIKYNPEKNDPFDNVVKKKNSPVQKNNTVNKKNSEKKVTSNKNNKPKKQNKNSSQDLYKQIIENEKSILN